MIEIVKEFNLTQVVMEPTRGTNTLDILLTSNPDLIRTTKILPGMSDHCIVLSEIIMKVDTQRKAPRSVLQYPKGNMGNIRMDLKQSLEGFRSHARENSVDS